MADGSTTPQETRRCCSCGWIVITVEGWVKLIETVMTFLAAILTLSYPYYRYKVGYEYQVGISTCAFVFVVLHIILRSVNCFEKVMPLLGMIGCFSLSVSLLAGSGIVYDAGNTYVKGDVMIGSGICGFIAAGLFFCEAIFYLFLLICRRSTPRRDGDDGKAVIEEIHGPAVV